MDRSDLPPRYVVLHHTGVAQPHYDLMFESHPGSGLKTWRSPHWPIDRPTPLEPLADHRAEYLTYEGPVSGGGGSVERVEHGRYVVTPSWDQPTDSNAWLVTLYEERPSGSVCRRVLRVTSPTAGLDWRGELIDDVARRNGGAGA